MEKFGGFGFSDLSRTVRKKRSNRPRNDSQSVTDNRDNSPLSSLPPSDNGSKASSDENTGHGTNSRRKELNLNQCNSRASYTNITEAETSLKISDEDGGFEEFHEAHTEGISESKDSITSKGNDNKPKRVKLKLGGVTRTIHAKSVSDAASVDESSRSDATRPRQKLILQDDSDEDGSPSPGKGSNLRGVPWKDFSRSGFIGRKASSSRGKIPEESASINQADKYEPVRKSKRVPKRRLLDGAFSDGGDDDEEIRFLEKLKTPKVAADYSAEYEDGEMGTKKHRRISRVLNRISDGAGYGVDAGDYGSSRSVKESKKSRSARVSEDNDYVEDEELVSDVDMESKRKKQRKEFVDASVDSNREMAVTTRQRAHLQTGKDPSSGSGASLIEFPNGLPPAPPRKQKEKLTDVEQQLKKAEAAQRRRMQMEKAARESEAEAIRKILGQDSSRKKREDKIKKRQEELTKERTANAMTLASNTVRWIMGPTGTVVTFPHDTGLPSILEPKQCCYPPPREQCAGPFCTNPYKYRDSKSRLPLCSLQCYKAIHEKMQPLSAC